MPALERYNLHDIIKFIPDFSLSLAALKASKYHGFNSDKIITFEN